MPQILYIDIRWLLTQQETVLPEHPSVADFSALMAGVARHRVDPPRAGTSSDASWRAAALLHTFLLLKPLPAYNVRFACATVIAYMHASGEGLDTPYGQLVDLAGEILSRKADVFTAADRIRTWRL